MRFGQLDLTFEIDRTMALTSVLSHVVGIDLGRDDAAALKAMALYLDEAWFHENQCFLVAFNRVKKEGLRVCGQPPFLGFAAGIECNRAGKHSQSS